MKPLDIPEFRELKAEVEAHKRQCGYCLIDLVDITEMRSAGRDEEQIAERVFAYFDDQAWPPPEQRPADQRWADYTVDRPVAREHTVEALMGGLFAGHLRETIARSRAEHYFDRFAALFEEPRRFYTGMGLGDGRYTFQRGVAIVSPTRAGVLWIVEGD